MSDRTQYSERLRFATKRKDPDLESGEGSYALQTVSVPLITLIDTSSSDFIYIGSALPSTAKSDAKWRVQRIDIRTSEIEILFAGSSEDFTHVWDNRTGLVYG